MVPFVLVLLALAASLLQILFTKKTRSKYMVMDTLVSWLFFFGIGMWGILGSYAHTALADETARSIGWAPGSPFQYEVAMGNLAYGICGVIASRANMGFRWATALFVTIFMWGAAVGHIREILTAQNMAPYNSGFLLYTAILLPAAILGLLIALSRQPKAT